MVAFANSAFCQKKTKYMRHKLIQLRNEANKLNIFCHCSIVSDAKY